MIKVTRQNLCPIEYHEQVALVNWLEMKGLKFSKLAQETFTRSWAIKARNKASGLRRGVPDLMVIKGDKLIFIELKRLQGSKTSPEQTEWIVSLNQCGAHAKVCRGAEEAINYISSV